MAFDDAHQAVDYWVLSADEAGADARAARRHARRGLSWRRERDGALVLRAVLDPVAAVAVDEELHRLEHDLYLADQADGSSRTTRQRSADALVEMATCSASTTNSRRPRPLISVLVGETTFAHTCELAAGTVLTPSEIVPLLGDADIERIIFEHPTASSARRSDARSPVPSDGRSRSATGAAPTTADAAPSPRAATSTTSPQCPTAASPATTTDECSARPTTGDPTNATHHPDNDAGDDQRRTAKPTRFPDPPNRSHSPDNEPEHSSREPDLAESDANARAQTSQGW
ncbi:hypothetical protein BH24ACT6_BH24ACT6_11240 [soil metagenome]